MKFLRVLSKELTDMDALKLKLCDIQGRLFELSSIQGYDSADFIKQFMNSEVAKNLDSPYNRMQWAGEEYLLEEIIDQRGMHIAKSEAPLPIDVLYWIGYIYRYWHYYSGDESKKIYKKAPVNTMKTNYLMFHTMAPEMAIDNLIEIHYQKKETT